MEKLSIQIVDDDVQFGRLVNRVVSDMGHTVEQISSSREIMQRYADFAPDVIFLDIFMPDQDPLDPNEVPAFTIVIEVNGRRIDA